MSNNTALKAAPEPDAAVGTITDLKQSAADRQDVASPELDGTTGSLVQTAASTRTEVMEKTLKAAKDAALFSQGSLEALAQATQVLASGSLDLYRQIVASSQSAFTESLADFNAFVAAGSVNERIELQTRLVQASARRAIAESSRFTRAGFDLAEQVSAPLTARVAVAAETFSFRGN